MLSDEETHLGEEHGEDSQADPVDDAGELRRIINCRDEAEQLVAVVVLFF